MTTLAAHELFQGMSRAEKEFFDQELAAYGYSLVGRFGLKSAPHSWFYLTDVLCEGNFKEWCKPGEQVFRYFTEASVAGGMAPCIKINLERKLVYFLTEASMAGEEFKFESRGVKAAWLLLKA
jgi:hypothetical protein